jgi:hypothetical protein
MIRTGREQMARNRQFKGKPVSRLIVSVEQETIEAIDKLIGYPFGSCHPARGNRAEFVRLAIERELSRGRNDDYFSPKKGQL